MKEINFFEYADLPEEEMKKTLLMANNIYQSVDAFLNQVKNLEGIVEVPPEILALLNKTSEVTYNMIPREVHNV